MGKKKKEKTFRDFTRILDQITLHEAVFVMLQENHDLAGNHYLEKNIASDF